MLASMYMPQPILFGATSKLTETMIVIVTKSLAIKKNTIALQIHALGRE